MTRTPTRAILRAHPTCGALGQAGAVTVDIAATRDALQMTYALQSRVPIRMPAPRGSHPGRYDELWFHTCCEMFIENPDSPGPYLEFNFSPTGDWASYAFNDTLRGMRSHRWPQSDELGSRGPPQVRASRTHEPQQSFPHRLVLEVTIPRIALGSCSRLYPTVVLETDAGISLWAIWHPVDRPHFHHRHNFLDTLEVP